MFFCALLAERILLYKCGKVFVDLQPALGIEAASSKDLQKSLEIQRIARPRQGYEIGFVGGTPKRSSLLRLSLGSTGFDSRSYLMVSTPSDETLLVNLDFKHLNGESNYALAA